MKEHFKSFRGQFPLNMAANAGNFAVNIAIGIFMVPYLIRHLGVAAYGLVPLATSLTLYLSLVTLALNGAVSRYMILAIHRNDAAGANRVFNTAFFSIAALAAALVPVAGALSWFSPRVFTVPAGMEDGARLLFLLAMSGFLVGIVSSNFSVVTYALNRLDIRNLIGISGASTRVASVIALFTFFGAGVAWVGLGFLLEALVALGLSMLAWRVLAPYLKVDPGSFDRGKLGEITHSGGWITVDQVGTLLLLNTDIMVVNLLFGPETTGRYGAVMQFPGLLRMMSAVFVGVFSPMIQILFARGDMDKLIFVCRKAIKFIGLGMALPIGLICGFSGSILGIWLGPDFARDRWLLAVMCAPLSVSLAILPLCSVQVAANKVRVPGLATCLSGLVMLALAVLLGGRTSLGVYGVALAGSGMFALRNIFFTSMYSTGILGVGRTVFLRPLAGGLAGTALVWAGCAAVNRVSAPGSWAGLVGASALIGSIYAAAVYFAAVSPEEKRMARSLLSVRRGGDPAAAGGG